MIKNINAREEYDRKTTPVFMVPVIFNPEIEVEILNDDNNRWGDHIFFIEKAFAGSQVENDIANTLVYSCYPINNLRLFCLIVDVYDKLALICPDYFLKNMNPSEYQSQQMVRAIYEFVLKIGFPIYLNGLSYKIWDDNVKSPVFRNVVTVDRKTSPPSHKVSALQIVQSIICVVESTGLRKGIVEYHNNMEYFYHGRVELRFCNEEIIYFAEDMFAAVRAQTTLIKPGMGIIKTCANEDCAKSFEALHGGQRYCGRPGCNPHTKYNHSEKGKARSKKAKTKAGEDIGQH